MTGFPVGQVSQTAAAMGLLIGQALIDQGVSQAEFSRRIGRSPKHVNRVIQGKSVATQAELDYWAYVLGFRWVIGTEPAASSVDGGAK